MIFLADGQECRCVTVPETTTIQDLVDHMLQVQDDWAEINVTGEKPIEMRDGTVFISASTKSNLLFLCFFFSCCFSFFFSCNTTAQAFTPPVLPSCSHSCSCCCLFFFFWLFEQPKAQTAVPMTSETALPLLKSARRLGAGHRARRSWTRTCGLMIPRCGPFAWHGKRLCSVNCTWR